MPARRRQKKSPRFNLLVTAFRAQADALEIEALAKRRLADEYDAAQERGEIRKQSDNQAYSKAKKAGPAEIGISAKEIHEARQIRDAEARDPRTVRRALDDAAKERGEVAKSGDTLRNGPGIPNRNAGNYWRNKVSILSMMS